jgi:hypothetical protein
MHNAALPEFRILSLDGGGIRGLLSAVWMRELERALDKPLGEYFDLIAGTSTGAIQACALGCGLSADRLAELYLSDRDEIFPGLIGRVLSRMRRSVGGMIDGPKYDGRGLDRILRQEFRNPQSGEDFLMGDLKTAVMVLSYDVSARDAVVFKSFRRRHAVLPLWQVCRASCAAPTLFPPHELSWLESGKPRSGVMVDGALVANNPAACALAESRRWLREIGEKRRIVLASFGTGATEQLPIQQGEARDWGVLRWAQPLFDIAFDGATDITHYVCEHALDARHYFRFQTPVRNTFVRGLDDVRDSNLKDLRERALAYVRAGPGKRRLSALVERLKRPRETAVPSPPEPEDDLRARRRTARRAASSLVRAAR